MGGNLSQDYCPKCDEYKHDPTISCEAAAARYQTSNNATRRRANKADAGCKCPAAMRERALAKLTAEERKALGL